MTAATPSFVKPPPAPAARAAAAQGEGHERALDVKGLTVGWDDVVLAKDVTFHVDRGEVFAILGGSGCGKSTLLRFLIGLETPREGSIDLVGHGPPELEHGLPPFGVMFQGGALFGSLSVLENVALPLREWSDLPVDAILAIARGKLRLVGLEAAADKLPSELSGGMKKRAAIARALALEPPIVFLDEPSAGLDPITSSELDQLLSTLARAMRLSLVVVTHELESVFRVARRCILLDKEAKGVIAEGDPRKLKESDDPRVFSFFNRGAAKGLKARDDEASSDAPARPRTSKG